MRKEDIIREAQKLSVKITENILKHIHEFADERRQMIELIVERGVEDRRVIFAMSLLPRHLFVPERNRIFSYEDSPLEIGLGQTISQPYIVALMTEHLEIRPTDKLLEIGTGSGYHTALLSMLGGRVVTVEYERELSERAQDVLRYLGISDIRFIIGDGSVGFEEEAPYDKICVSSATPDVPPPLLEQLKENGIMIIPIGDETEQVLCKIIKRTDGRGFQRKEICPCRFVKMKGRYGFH